jgi:hypothetical protein
VSALVSLVSGASAGEASSEVDVSAASGCVVWVSFGVSVRIAG